MRRHGLGAVGLALSAALLAGCGSGGRAVAGGAAASRSPVASPTLAFDAGLGDPDAKVLAEPTSSGNAALLNKSRETSDICTGMVGLDQIVEPPALDAAKLSVYAQGYYGALQLISATKRINDKQAQAKRDHMTVPPKEVAEALATERAEIFAFSQRVAFAQNLVQAGTNTHDELIKRLTDAEYRLATGPYQGADALLGQYVLKHCF
jgi:hypothetical protein